MVLVYWSERVSWGVTIKHVAFSEMEENENEKEAESGEKKEMEKGEKKHKKKDKVKETKNPQKTKTSTKKDCKRNFHLPDNNTATVTHI